MTAKTFRTKQYDGQGEPIYDDYRYESSEYCPNCGIKGVYYEDSDGDYYVGPTIFCLACNSTWNMPMFATDSEFYSDRIELLREQVKKAKANDS